MGDWHFQRPDAIMKSQSQTNETFIGQLLCAVIVFATGDAPGLPGDGGGNEKEKFTTQ